MTKSPEISIVMPVYNAEKYLPQMLDSIFQQTFSDFELICVNDGSKDNSLQILQETAKEHFNMKIINQINKGVSSARNKGLQEAKGKYVYFPDADDIMHPQLLEILLSQIKKYDADVAVCDYVKTASPNSIIFTDYKNVEAVVDDCPFQKFIDKEENYFYCLWTKLYKYTILDKQKFVENIHYGEDMLFNLEIFSKVQRVVKVSQPLYFYIERSTSCVNTAFNDKKAQSFVNLIKVIHQKFGKYAEYPLIKRNISSRSMKFLMKKIYNTHLEKKYYAEILKLYKNGTFNLALLGVKNIFRITILRVYNLIKSKG